MRLALYLLTVGTLWAAAPTLSFITVDAPKDAQGVTSPTSIRGCWATDQAASSVMKIGPDGGPYTEIVNRTTSIISLYETHCVLADARQPATQYYFILCSTNAGAEEGCSSQQTATTGAAYTQAQQQPLLPTPVDTTWTAGTGDTHTVSGSCGDATTGIQALIDGAASNDEIVIPEALSPGCVALVRIPSTVTNLLIRTDAVDRPPAGVRDDGTSWGTTKVYRSYRDMRNAPLADVQALTGKPVPHAFWPCGPSTALNCWPPGSLVYARATQTWLIKKVALDGNVRTITGATATTPIVITSAGHGFMDGEVACIKGTLGMVEARGCWTVGSATTDTFELLKRDNTDSAGTNAYTGGGEAQGLVWEDQAEAVDSMTPLDGVACVTPGSWGRGRTAPGGDADHEQYQCGSDAVWYKVNNDNTVTNDSNGTPGIAVFNALPGANHIRIEGIDCADPPIPEMEEYKYGPRNSAAGIRTGGCFLGSKGSSYVDFNQTISSTNLRYNRPYSVSGGDSVYTGLTSQFILRNGTHSAGGVGVAYIDPASEAAVVSMDSPGPIAMVNNTCNAGPFCYFSQQGYGMTTTESITFERNDVNGICDYNFGSDFYTIDTGLYGPLRQWFRQMVEWKTGNKISITGNSFYCLPVSVSPVATAIEIGSQAGNVGFSIDVAGVVTINAQRPNPAMQVEDRVMVYNSNIATDTFIARVADLSPFTLKLLNGDPYDLGAGSGTMCQIDLPWQTANITIENNQFSALTTPWNIFGNSYQDGDRCQSAPAGPVMARNNLAYLQAVPQGAGAFPAPGINSSVAWPAGLVDYIQVLNNTAICNHSADSNNESGFVTDADLVNFKSTGLIVTKNLMCAQDAGVLGPGNAGTTTLNLRWPLGWTFTGNAFVATPALSSTGEPSGQAYPTAAEVEYTSDGVPKYTSPYASYGIDLAALRRASGLLTNPRVHTDANSVIVQFTSPVAGQHWYAEISDDDGATWTRATSTGSGYEQSADVTASAATVYDVRMVGPQGITALGKVRTP